LFVYSQLKYSAKFRICYSVAQFHFNMGDAMWNAF